MRNYEIGILPMSTCSSFSPAPQTRAMFYYPIFITCSPLQFRHKEITPHRRKN